VSNSAFEFDEIYVISDTHMGGGAGAQIFDAGKLLAQTIDLLAETSPRSRVALVINGDSVDFIAEPNPVYFDPTGAASRLERIMTDIAFKPVFDSLAKFISKKRRSLIFNLGNHDLELAIPDVREQLLSILTGGDETLRGRVHLVFDGEGVHCLVGSAQVLCLHGNEVDTWNICDYEELRLQARDLNLGLTRKAWVPNAGTKMVIDIMNGVKKKFPFVDLLKPEKEAVVPTLYALDPSVKSKLSGVFSIVGRLTKDSIRRFAGFLEGTAGEMEIVDAAGGQQALDRVLANAFSESPRKASAGMDESANLLLETERRFRNLEDPRDMLGSGSELETLGTGGAIVDWFRGRPKDEILREALEGLAEDKSFDLDHKDATFVEIDKLVGRQIDFTITGHTHQRRALQRPNGRYYYNSGTWVRLIRLIPDVLGDAEKFKRYFSAFEKGTMAALDNEPGMILRAPTVVAVRARGGEVEGALCEATLKSSGVVLQEVPNSKFVKR